MASLGGSNKMIITRAPLRISFAGGMTDLPEFYENYGAGVVVNSAIDKYVYVMLNDKFDSDIRVVYKDFEDVNNVDNISHPIVRAVFKEYGVEDHTEVMTMADLPAKTGMGSSSAFTVALLKAVRYKYGYNDTAKELAEEACRIEIDVLGEKIGKQDQYASAYGGLRRFTFLNNRVRVEDLELDYLTKRNLFGKLVLYYLSERDNRAGNVLEKQSKQFSDYKDQLIEFRDQAITVARELRMGNLDIVGESFEASWKLKTMMGGGNNQVDSILQLSSQESCLGGKLCGAGSTGILMMYIPSETQSRATSKLHHLRRIFVGPDNNGAMIVYED